MEIMLTDSIQELIIQLDQSDLGESPHKKVLDLLEQSEMSFIVCTNYLREKGILKKYKAKNLSQSAKNLREGISDNLKQLDHEQFIQLVEGLKERLKEVKQSQENFWDDASGLNLNL